MKTRIFGLFLALVLILAALAVPASADPGVQGIEILGASIRTEGEQGLRFVGKIQKTGDIALTTGNDANFGILLIPETQLAANAEITEGTTDVMVVPAKYLLDQAAVEAVDLTYDGDYYYFSAVLTGIPAEFYGTNLVARAYVNNGGTYSYSAQVKRSVQYVAQAIKTEQGGSAPAYVDTVLADYEAVGSDILVNAQNLSALVTYPEYPAYISRDTLYSVSVSQGLSNKPLTVYNETADYSHFLYDSTQSRALGAMDGNRRFCEFAFDGAAVRVKIKVNKNFSTYTVSPTSKGFESTYANGVITVTLEKPEQFVVILDNDYNTALAVFADKPETNVPAKGASNVIYVEGDNNITDPSGVASYTGTNNEVLLVSKNNAKVYIAPGAVLKKRVVFTRADNNNNSAYHCGIFGRGIILDPYSDIASSNQNSIPSYTDLGNAQSLQGTVTFHGYGCTMEDVKVVNSANFNVLFKQDYGHTNNVKLLSTEMSSDGFTTTASKGNDPGSGWIENCFVYVGDNALVIQNDSGKTGYRFQNITIGTTCAAIYPQHNANTTLEDIYVFRADDGLINVGQSGVGSQTVNITNLDALDCVKTPTLFKAWKSPGTATKTYNLTNVVMRYTTGGNGSFTPGSNTASNISISNTNSSSSGYVLNLTNLYMGGQQVNGTNSLMGNNSNYYSSAYPTSNGITINFAVNGANLPAHTSVPVAQTANYTGGADVVAGPVRDWTRYQSYKCKVAKSGNAYTVTDSTGGESSQWGLSYNLTEYVKANGTGTYTVTFNTNKSVDWYVVKTSNTTGDTTKMQSGSASSKTITITVNNVQDYTYQIVLKAPSTSTGSFTLNSSSFSKTA